MMIVMVFCSAPTSVIICIRRSSRPAGLAIIVSAACLTVRVVGVDDWAWRKGHNYGTIVVDLERREVVDVLPDRSTASISAWLERRPEIEIVSRDRCGSYAHACELYRSAHSRRAFVLMAEVFNETGRGAVSNYRQFRPRNHRGLT